MPRLAHYLTYKEREQDLFDHVDKQPDKSAYLKNLIRQDMINKLQQHQAIIYTPQTGTAKATTIAREPTQTPKTPKQSESETQYTSARTGKSISWRG